MKFRPAYIALFLLLVSARSFADGIYVYKEADGAIRFSTKPPPAGVTAKLFKAKESSFSYYKGIKSRAIYTGKIFPNLYKEFIRSSALQHGVAAELVTAVIHAESGFNPRAVSPKGALGLMQLMPDTARRWGVRKPFSPEENIKGGVKHLKMLINRYRGNLSLIIAAYNAGEGAVDKYRGIPPYDETREYVRRVMSLRQKYQKAL